MSSPQAQGRGDTNDGDGGEGGGGEDGGVGDDGTLNMVFVGVRSLASAAEGGAQGAACKAQSVVEAAGVFAEKPFLSVDASGRFSLEVPGPRNAVGSRLGRDSVEDGDGGEVGDGGGWRTVPFERVFMASAAEAPPSGEASGEASDAVAAAMRAQIQEALDAGLDVVLTPGIFQLDAPLTVATPNQVSPVGLLPRLRNADRTLCTERGSLRDQHLKLPCPHR